MALRKRRKSSKKKLGDADWNSRYAPNWKEICAIAHRATKGICCLCLCSSSVEIHHARYRDKRGAIAGREIAGVTIFPLCNQCHETAHASPNWIKAKLDPVLNNHNTPEFVKKLKLGYKLLNEGTIPPPPRKRSFVTR